MITWDILGFIIIYILVTLFKNRHNMIDILTNSHTMEKYGLIIHYTNDASYYFHTNSN